MRNTCVKAALAVLLTLGSSVCVAGKFVNGFGVGLQYGGVVGWQGAYLSNANRFRVGLGYRGTTWGYDRFILPKVSLGTQFFGNQYRIGAALNLNYYPSGNSGQGWVFGLDVYRGVDTANVAVDILEDLFNFTDNDAVISIDEEPENGVFFSLGYHL